MSSRHPLDSDQAVVVSLEYEDSLLHVRVPDEHIVVEACTQDHTVVRTPVE